jgi:hypothetical protein
MHMNEKYMILLLGLQPISGLFTKPYLNKTRKCFWNFKDFNKKDALIKASYSNCI